jgi:hypothetical protein
MWKLFLPLIRLFLKTPKKGAATSIYLASSSEGEGVTGTYFAGSKPKASSPASHDTAAAARLWQRAWTECHVVARRCDAAVPLSQRPA